jgi:hypothetical protein
MCSVAWSADVWSFFAWQVLICVSGAGDDYIDLANTYLFVEAQIIEDDDIALDGGADVRPVNLWMHTGLCRWNFK